MRNFIPAAFGVYPGEELKFVQRLFRTVDTPQHCGGEAPSIILEPLTHKVGVSHLIGNKALAHGWRSGDNAAISSSTHARAIEGVPPSMRAACATIVPVAGL